jgi:hypothetical protein
MTRVRSLSNHPYGGTMRLKGAEYDIDNPQVLDLLVSLKRVVLVSDESTQRAPDRQTYGTREMRAGGARAGSSNAAVMTTAGPAAAGLTEGPTKPEVKRPAAQQTRSTGGPPAPSPPDKT